jgi:hypothetical protein
VCSSILCLLLAAVTSAGALQEGTPPSNPGVPLSLEDVVKLSQAGVSEDVIITRIKKNGKAFDLSAEELVDLKKAGISETIVKFLLDPSQPYTPPAPPAQAPPAKSYPHDTYASKVPPEPGLYYFRQGVPVKTEIKTLLGENEGAGLGKALKKGKLVAYLVGPTATTRVKEQTPVFYVRLPEAKGIEDIVLVALQERNGRRETRIGPEDLRQFDSLEVGPRLFKLSTGKLFSGEYLFFLVGSAEPTKGTYGKGWDFGID